MKRHLKRLLPLLLVIVTVVSTIALMPAKEVTMPFGKVVTIGFTGTAEALVTLDFPVVGTADDEFQAALDALPAGGGKIVALSGSYVFAATVTRAINNVTIEGAGVSSAFSHDGTFFYRLAWGRRGRRCRTPTSSTWGPPRSRRRTAAGTATRAA